MQGMLDGFAIFPNILEGCLECKWKSFGLMMKEPGIQGTGDQDSISLTCQYNERPLCVALDLLNLLQALASKGVSCLEVCIVAQETSMTLLALCGLQANRSVTRCAHMPSVGAMFACLPQENGTHNISCGWLFKQLLWRASKFQNLL